MDPPVALERDSKEEEEEEQLDVIIVGAGISGIGFAYRLQERLGPDLRYCILEGRHEIGGTWSLFQYPGKQVSF